MGLFARGHTAAVCPGGAQFKADTRMAWSAAAEQAQTSGQAVPHGEVRIDLRRGQETSHRLPAEQHVFVHGCVKGICCTRKVRP